MWAELSPLQIILMCRTCRAHGKRKRERLFPASASASASVPPVATPDARLHARTHDGHERRVGARPAAPLTLGWQRAGGAGGQRHMAAKSGSITRRQSRPASHHSTKTHRGGAWHRLGVQTRRAGWCRGTAATSRELRTPLARRSAHQEPEINTTVRCIWAHLVRFAVPWFATPSLDILCKKRASSRVDREWRNSVHPPVPASGLVKLLKRHDDAMRCDAVW